MKSKINKADSQCHPHKIHNLPLKPFTAVKVKPKHSVFYLLQCLKYEPGSLTRARVRRIYLLSCQSFSQLLLLYSILFSLSIGFLFIFFSYILSIVMQQVFQKKLCQFPYFLFKEFCRCLKLKNPPWIIIYPGFYIFNVPVLFFVKIFPFWNMAAD